VDGASEKGISIIQLAIQKYGVLSFVKEILFKYETQTALPFVVAAAATSILWEGRRQAMQ
jgi:hypothetical protein